MNGVKTGILLIFMTGILVLAGRLIGGTGGMVVAFGLALVMNGVSYWFCDKIVLRMYGAQPVSEAEAPELYGIISRLAQQAGIPMPRLYMIPTDMPNAFATGRNPEHAVVAVTQGMMRILGKDEVEGVLAHELAHVKNRDILISTIAATLAGAIMMLASFARFAALFGGLGGRDDREGGLLGLLALMIVGPIAAMVVQLAISRSREYQADATGAQLCGHPLSLANALVRLDNASQYAVDVPTPATAHMFIVNPLRGGGIRSLFSTHPSTEDRVNRLRAMAQEMGQGS
jgi:heat shock protein HtpX